MSNNKTPQTESELNEIFKEVGIEDKNFQRVYAYYKKCFKEEYDSEYKDWTEEDYEETGESAHTSALFVTNLYLETFLREKSKGHDDEWSHAAAASLEDDETTYGIIYNNLFKSNPELAVKELLILSKSFGGDKLFEKHYLLLFEIGEMFSDPAERAQNYSKIYKEEIAKGKTEIYSHQYAYLISMDGYHEIYCEEYAFAFDKAISETKSEVYANIYAERYASAISDFKIRYGISENENALLYEIEEVNGYMNAWEYSEKHQLKDFHRFAEIYENVHLNTVFLSKGKYKESKEEIDSSILKEALQRFNK
ncbi:hypothetical protein [Flavobacterium sp. DSR3-2]|uniref:hypothetical protein n=1 Tax=Flavobacterium sp. DSR3-2 TaxID=2804634 RepID=UPI003CEB7E06